MDSVGRTVDHLDKVGLRLTFSPMQEGSAVEEIETSLILGIGIEGLAPIEKMLVGKTVGQRIEMPVQNGCADTYFGHLGPAFCRQISSEAPFHMQATILSIQRAEGREVVKAMASLSAGCGGGCDCGCGCS